MLNFRNLAECNFEFWKFQQELHSGEEAILPERLVAEIGDWINDFNDSFDLTYDIFLGLLADLLVEVCLFGAVQDIELDDAWQDLAREVEVNFDPVLEIFRELDLIETSLSDSEISGRASYALIRASDQFNAGLVPEMGHLQQSALSSSLGNTMTTPIYQHDTPDYLVPKMREEPVTPPVYYRELIIQTGEGDVEDAEEISQPLDIHLDRSDHPVPSKPLIGALLTYEQGWYERGLALGELLHSLCLAPGEVTQIAITQFTKSTSGKAGQTEEQVDSSDAATAASSRVHELQMATQFSVQSGDSFQANAAAQASASGSYNTLFSGGAVQASVSGSVGVSRSTSESKSATAANGAKDVNQTTQQHSVARRGRRAIQVQETSQRESQTATTRVIANYNHMHSLNVLFFEVLQIYELTAHVVHAERVIFVPIKPLEIDKAFLIERRDLVVKVMKPLEGDDFGTRLDELLEHYDQINTPLAARRKEVRKKLDDELKRFDIRPRDGEDPNNDEWLDRRVRESFGDHHDYTIDAVSRHLLTRPEKIEVRFQIPGGPPRNERYNNPLPDGSVPDLIAEIVARYGNLPDFRLAGPGFGMNRQELLQIAKFFKIRQYLQTYRKMEFEHFHNESIEQTEVAIFKARDAISAAYLNALNPIVFTKMLMGKRFGKESLEHLVEPKPIAFHGHYIAFKFRHAAPDGDQKFSRSYTSAFEDENGDIDHSSIPTAKIVIPSGGVFSEAVLGQAFAAEKIDLTRFWKWQDSPIPILPTQIGTVGMDRRGQDVGHLEHAGLDTSSAIAAQLQAAPTLDLSSMIQRINANVRDMSGRAELASTLSAHIQATKEGSIRSGELTQQGIESVQKFTIDALNSDVVKTAAMGMFPEAEGATVLGGLMGAAGGGSAPTPTSAPTNARPTPTVNRPIRSNQPAKQSGAGAASRRASQPTSGTLGTTKGTQTNRKSGTAVGKKSTRARMPRSK